MNIPITGINGFVDSNLTEKKKEHHKLYRVSALNKNCLRKGRS